ncbi:hypothetical protein HNY73_006238 [Argiope bruennichi]|uniref:Uncharacterized protein n=1 Tax=Argiope bruennichi TaxID=94029 RepID=A0A8T0FLT9_ARGBR|nr:hypothetical protein HNY73_006238 [Argiope bruennichi]
MQKPRYSAKFYATEVSEEKPLTFTRPTVSGEKTIRSFPLSFEISEDSRLSITISGSYMTVPFPDIP